MRLAVIANLHGNLLATQAALDAIDRLELPVDLTVCLGNIVGLGPQPNEVVDLVRSQKISSVRGNYDEAVAGLRPNSGEDHVTTRAAAIDWAAVQWNKQVLTDDNKSFLGNLALQARVSVTGAAGRRVEKVEDDQIKNAKRDMIRGWMIGSAISDAFSPSRRRPDLPARKRKPDEGPPKKNAKAVVLVHGTPRETIEGLSPGSPPATYRAIVGKVDGDVVIHGHSGKPFHHVVSGIAFIGVASTGAYANEGRAEFAVIEVAGSEIDVEFQYASYDHDAAIRVAANSDMPREVVELLSLSIPS
jgi:predicted phosphodiesterase